MSEVNIWVGVIVFCVLLIAFIRRLFIFVKVAFFSAGKNEWIDGHPPSSWPREWIEEGMRTDPDDPKNVIPCWRKSAAYYANLN